MKETYEFRLSPEGVAGLFGLSDYLRQLQDKLHIARGVVGDDQYLRIAELDRNLRETQKFAFFGWEIKRTYSEVEIERAELFLLKLRYKHASGEEFGTWYTDSRLEPNCGLGRKQVRIVQTNPFHTILEDTRDLRCGLGSRQVGPLQIPFRKLMKGRDIFLLWSGETIVLGRMARLIEAGEFSGSLLRTIWDTQRGSRSHSNLSSVPSGTELLSKARRANLEPSDQKFWAWVEETDQLPLFERTLWEQKELWESGRECAESKQDFRQLMIQSGPLQVCEHTEIGDHPFDDLSSESCKCRSGEVRGMNLLSPLSVERSSWDGSDICHTDIFFGGRQGLFRPRRHIVISRRLLTAMRLDRMKGFEFEIVRTV